MLSRDTKKRIFYDTYYKQWIQKNNKDSTYRETGRDW
jgi:hypothetical protein